MKTTLMIAVVSLFLTALTPGAAAIQDPCGDDGVVRDLPQGDETCQDVEYVTGHWVTQTALNTAGRAVDIAVCLSGADPYNWAPSDYVACVRR